MFKKRNLELLEDFRQENDILERLIKKTVFKGEPIHILEAGCGRSWPLKLGDIQYFLTGVDMDKKALELRIKRFSDLHEIIEGDLCLIDLGKDKFDVIYCSFVLEHIEKADLVINKFITWVKPNGLIIIRIPDPDSVQGFVTRITPHWFHIFYYRFFLGAKNAGKPGYSPYPTYYNPIVSRSGIHNLCNDSARNMVLESEYGDGWFQPGRPSMKRVIQLIKKFINIISLGFLSDKHTSLLYVLRKKKLSDISEK